MTILLTYNGGCNIQQLDLSKFTISSNNSTVIVLLFKTIVPLQGSTVPLYSACTFIVLIVPVVPL